MERGRGGSDRDRMREALLKRSQEAYDKKDSWGRFGSYIKDEYTDRLWKCGESEHTMDIIPYVVGPDHPTLKEGEIAFKLDVYVHPGIGGNEDQYICMALMYNKPCPVCEDQRQKRRSGDVPEAEVNKLNAKRRTLYNVVVLDNNKEIEKGVQLFDVSQRYMDRELSARSRNPKTGEFINYAHPDKDIGKSIYFKRKGMGMLNTDFLGHSFLDRDEAVSEQDLKDALPLDQVIIIPTYEEVYKAHFGVNPGGAASERRETESQSERGSRREPRREPVQDAPQGRRQSVTKPDPDNKCPAGGVMGKDIQSFKECDDCPVWDDCRELERGGIEGAQSEGPGREKEKEPERPARRLALRETAQQQEPPSTIGRRARR